MQNNSKDLLDYRGKELASEGKICKRLGAEQLKNKEEVFLLQIGHMKKADCEKIFQQLNLEEKIL